jgi:hypothetical protein
MMRRILCSGLALSYVVLSGCVSDHAGTIRRIAGLDVCWASKIEVVPQPKESQDVSAYNISLNKTCFSKLMSSSYNASAAECEKMLPTKRECFYIYNHHPVVFKTDPERYEASVRVW